MESLTKNMDYVNQKLEVMYKREYYQKNDVRVTIDTDISYKFYSKERLQKIRSLQLN